MTKIYPILVSPQRGNNYVVMSDEPGCTNISREPRTSGWLGTTNNTSRTALGAFTTQTAANRAARKALGYDARQGRMRYDYDAGQGYRIEYQTPRFF